MSTSVKTPLLKSLSPAFQAFRLPVPGPLITLRGLVLLCFVAFLLSGPVPDESDIVGAVMAYSLLCYFLITALAGAMNATLLYKNLQIHLHSSAPKDESSAQIISDQKTPYMIALENVRVFPFFFLELQLLFENGAVESERHVLTGRGPGSESSARRHVKEVLKFPHRGFWNCTGVQVDFRDQTGLINVRWRIQSEDSRSTFQVHPPQKTNSRFPVLSSSTRTGDLVSDVRERLGDPFDLKQYHPSDGMKKIVWKIFAKSGELISRHPERSMTPEGLTVVFILADQSEDHVCSSALAYLQKLSELNLEIVVGHEGLSPDSPTTTPDTTEEMLIKTVWRQYKKNKGPVADDLIELLDQTRTTYSSTQIDRVILVASRERFPNDQVSPLVSCAFELEKRSIRPVIFLVNSSAPSRAVKRPSKDSSSIPDLIGRFLPFLVFNAPQKSSSNDDNVMKYHEFIQICQRQKWEVILEEEL